MGMAWTTSKLRNLQIISDALHVGLGTDFRLPRLRAVQAYEIYTDLIREIVEEIIFTVFPPPPLSSFVWTISIHMLPDVYLGSMKLTDWDGRIIRTSTG